MAADTNVMGARRINIFRCAVIMLVGATCVHAPNASAALVDSVVEVAGPDVPTMLLNQYDTPGMLATGPDGDLYSYDVRAQVAHISSTGDFVNRIDAPVGYSMEDITSSGLFSAIGYGFAVAPDGSYYLASKWGDDVVLHFSASGTVLGSFGSTGSGLGEIGYINGVDVAANGFVYVTDSGNGKILQYTSSGALVDEITGSDVAVAADGSLWVTDASCGVQHRDAIGNVLATITLDPAACNPMNPQLKDIATDSTHLFALSSAGIDTYLLADGSHGTRLIHANQPAGANDVENPTDIAILAGGNIAVADSSIVRGTRIFDGTGTLIKQASNTFTGAVVGANITQPVRVGVSSSGTMYVTDPTHGVLSFSADGTFLGMIGTQGTEDNELEIPIAVAVAPNNTIWISDYGDGRIKRFAPDGTFLSGFGGLGTNDGEFQQPLGIAFASDNSYWVVDAGRHDVQHFAADDTLLHTVGTTGTSGSGSQQLNFPTGVCTADDNSIWITDAGNNRIRHFSSTGALLGGFGGGGSGDGQFDFPAYVACLSNGLLLVTDALNHRVQWLTTSGDMVYSYGSLGSGSADKLRVPYGATFANGHTVISDSWNSRLLILTNDQLPPSVQLGIAGRYVNARSRSRIRVTAVDTDSVVVRITAQANATNAPVRDGIINTRRIKDGRYALRVEAFDAAGNKSSRTKSIVLDREAPTVSSDREVTVRSSTSVRVRDNVSGVRRSVRAIGNLHIGRNVRRILVRDKAGNTNRIRITVTYRPSLAQPWTNPAGSSYYMDRSSFNDTTVRPALIRETQLRLKLLGFRPNHLRSTGELDTPTQRHIAHFQQQQGIPPTGQLDFTTRMALDLAITRLG